jgi:hypothetical protein
MRPGLVLCYLGLCLGLASSASGATGSVFKVLPHLLDTEGRRALSPSLYDRDAYQFYLRTHPEKRGGIRFDVQWKTSGAAWEPLNLRVQIRGTLQGHVTKDVLIQAPVFPSGMFGRWTALDFTGDDYKNFGEVTAWRVTLWEGENLLAEQKSFLW